MVSFARVCYGNANAMLIGPPIGSWPHPDFELAATRHGLNSINDEVDKNLTHLASKAHKFRGIFCSEFNLDTSCLKFAPEQYQD